MVVMVWSGCDRPGVSGWIYYYMYYYMYDYRRLPLCSPPCLVSSWRTLTRTYSRELYILAVKLC